MKVFLDDYRVPTDVDWINLPKGDWVIVRNYTEFRTLLESLDEAPEYIAFDHDLADAHYAGDFSDPNEKTGLDCAKALFEIAANKGWKMPKYTVHSLNPSGAANIFGYLRQAKDYL